MTGASGFVGRPTVTALLERGAEVHAVARTPGAAGAIWHAIDLLVPGAARAAVADLRPDIVLHLAWCVEHGAFWTDPRNPVWLEASLELACASIAAGVSRFVGTGTCWEYDWPADGDCIEDVTPLAVHTPYDEAKARLRDSLAEIGAATGMATAWARLFFLYGAGEDRRRLVSGIARALAAGEEARCGSGVAVRDFLDVEEAGCALAALALSDASGPVNIGSGQGIAIADFAHRLGRLSGQPELVRIGALPDRPDDPPRIVANIGKLVRETGFRPAPPDDQSLGRALEMGRAA